MPTPRTDATLLEALEPRRLLAAGPLPDDAYENNDTPKQVLNAAGPGNSSFGAITADLSIPSLKLTDNADWYRFRLTSPGDADSTLSIAFKQRKGNLDLALFNARGRQQLAISATNRATESISLDGLSAGWYFARITGRDNAINRNYSLTITAPASNPGGNDDDTPDVELNDSFDLVDTAPAGASGSPNLGILAQRTINTALDDTYDIYKFTVPSTPGANAKISIASPTPFNLSLFNAQRTSIAFAAGYMGQTSISLANLAPGDYYIQVTHYVLGLSGSFDYTLSFDAGATNQS